MIFTKVVQQTESPDKLGGLNESQTSVKLESVVQKLSDVGGIHSPRFAFLIVIHQGSNLTSTGLDTTNGSYG